MGTLSACVCVSPVQDFTVELQKSPGGGLGFTVVGGVSTTGGCYVRAVLQDPALSDGRLRPGDRLIQVRRAGGGRNPV